MTLVSGHLTDANVVKMTHRKFSRQGVSLTYLLSSPSENRIVMRLHSKVGKRSPGLLYVHRIIPELTHRLHGSQNIATR